MKRAFNLHPLVRVGVAAGVAAWLLTGCAGEQEPDQTQVPDITVLDETIQPPAPAPEKPFVVESYVSEIDPEFAERMQNVTLRDYPGCATIDELRIIDVPYLTKEGANASGRIVMHAALAEEVGDIFEEIYHIGFRFELVAPAEEVTSLHGADPSVGVEIDNELMAKNVTSGFNCRTLDGEVDKHGEGFALDMNPLENPMIIPNPYKTPNADYEFSPPAAEDIWIADNPDRTMKLETDYIIGSQVIAAFENRGWRWGGRWNSLYDGQHFDKVVE